MDVVSSVVFYILIFLTVYVQIFFLVTFLENRRKIFIRGNELKLAKYPSVTIMVPCWNEERTVYKTVRSLLELDYPKNKIQIFLIDDGSTDGTWCAIKKFSKYPNIKIFQKENGGKYTALNLGLVHVETDFVGCLDADSFADKYSLIRLMSYFEKDPSVMAVAPSIIACNSKNIIQNAQKAEYHMSVFMKKMLGFIEGIHVTPGPLTIFRKKVFDDLGPYRHAHNTEDMEIAYRMQKNHYKIEQCNDAFVYTNTPATAKKLYRQRLRWIYGFLNNTIDYKSILFRKKYGHFSTFTLPAALLSICALIFIVFQLAYDLSHFLYNKIIEIRTVGFHFFTKSISFDPFFINTESLGFVFIFIYAWVIVSIILGRKMAEGKWKFSPGIIYYLTVFAFIAPFWLIKAIYNTILKRKPAWR